MSTDPERQDAAMESEMERSAQAGEQSGIDPLSWFFWALILIWMLCSH